MHLAHLGGRKRGDGNLGPRAPYWDARLSQSCRTLRKLPEALGNAVRGSVMRDLISSSL